MSVSWCVSRAGPATTGRFATADGHVVDRGDVRIDDHELAALGIRGQPAPVRRVGDVEAQAAARPPHEIVAEIEDPHALEVSHQAVAAVGRQLDGRDGSSAAAPLVVAGRAVRARPR
jgi:hypothetical protein